MAEFHSLLKWSHIVLGGLSLLVFWLAAASVKGAPRHVRLGRLYAWMSYPVLLTALVSIVWGMFYRNDASPP